MKSKIIYLLFSLSFFLFSFGQLHKNDSVLQDSDPGRTKAKNFLTKKEIREGWVLLFDGVSSKGWTSVNDSAFPQQGWVIKDGLLTLMEGQNGGDIKTTAEFSDFELSLDFLYTPGCNSGIKYFFTNYKVGGNLGLEFQILDDRLAEDNLRADHLCGALYDIFPPDSSRKRLNSPGEWNSVRIISKGMHVEHWLNGIKIVEFERGSSEYLTGVAKSKYKTEPVFGMIEKGSIMLQDHGHTISFRNIKIRSL